MFSDLDDPNPPALGDRLRAGVRARVRTRRRRRMALGGAAGAVVLGVGGLYARAMRPLEQVTTLELDAAHAGPLEVGRPTTVLVLGTDSDEGTDGPDGGGGRAGATTGVRVDSALLLRTDPVDGTSRLMSLPRDLEVDAADGTTVRLADLYAGEGVEGVLRAAEQATGMPVDHVVVLDFVAFRDAVDALGGIAIQADAPLRDEQSGLSIEQAGCVRLDGAQALAFVRARHLERLVDGVWESDPSGDLGRMQRQRTLAEIVRAQVGVPDPLTLHDLTSAVADDLMVDAGLDVDSMVSILRDVLVGQLQSLALPTTSVTAEDGSVRLVPSADAPAVTQWLATGGSGEPDQAMPPSTHVTDESVSVLDPFVSACG